MPEYSRHQKKIIERYYDRRGQIMITRLEEIVSELYLASSEAQVKRLWSRAEKAMQGLKVPASIQTHILAERRPETLARNLREWQKGKL